MTTFKLSAASAGEIESVAGDTNDPKLQTGIIDLITVYERDRTSLESKGIYRISSDSLIYCISRPNDPRPTAFSPKKGTGQTLVSLKRLQDELN
jgi:hypothetical protein